MKLFLKFDKKRRVYSSALIIVISIIDVFSLYYIKYRNQKLPFVEFSLANTGNLLDLIFLFLLVSGAVTYAFNKGSQLKPSLLFFLTLLMTVFLAAAEFSTVIKIPFTHAYLFDYPLYKVLTAALFSAYQFVQFILLSILWLSFFGVRELLFLRAITNSIIITVLLILFAFYNLHLKKDELTVDNNQQKLLRVAVVLGAAVWTKNKPSPSLAARLDKAVELYKSHLVDRIQLTGGNAPGELSEAEVALKYIKAKGVNSKDIWLEKNTNSTLEQIQYIRNFLIPKKNISNIVVISDSYHLRRVLEICKFYKIKINVVASNLALSFDNKIYYKLRESTALIIFWFFAL